MAFEFIQTITTVHMVLALKHTKCNGYGVLKVSAKVPESCRDQEMYRKVMYEGCSRAPRILETPNHGILLRKAIDPNWSQPKRGHVCHGLWCWRVGSPQTCWSRDDAITSSGCYNGTIKSSKGITLNKPLHWSKEIVLKQDTVTSWKKLWLIFLSFWPWPRGEPGAMEYVVHVIVFSYEGPLLAVISILWAVQHSPHPHNCAVG